MRRKAVTTKDEKSPKGKPISARVNCTQTQRNEVARRIEMAVVEKALQKRASKRGGGVKAGWAKPLPPGVPTNARAEKSRSDNKKSSKTSRRVEYWSRAEIQESARWQ